MNNGTIPNPQSRPGTSMTAATETTTHAPPQPPVNLMKSLGGGVAGASSRLASLWYVLAPPEVTANHPITQAQEREKARQREERELHMVLSGGGGGVADASPSSLPLAGSSSPLNSNASPNSAGGTSFARISGLPTSQQQQQQRPTSSSSSSYVGSGGGDGSRGPLGTTIKTTDGADLPVEEVYSPYPIGGFYALPSEEAVCELVLQWFEDYELQRRRRAAIVVVKNEAFDETAVDDKSKNSRTREEIQVRFPSMIEYDDINVLNFAEAYLQTLVVMEPMVGVSSGRPLSSSPLSHSLRPYSSSSKGGAPVNTHFAPSSDDSSPYVFHGQSWLAAALRRYFKNQAISTAE